MTTTNFTPDQVKEILNLDQTQWKNFREKAKYHGALDADGNIQADALLKLFKSRVDNTGDALREQQTIESVQRTRKHDLEIAEKELRLIPFEVAEEVNSRLIGGLIAWVNQLPDRLESRGIIDADACNSVRKEIDICRAELHAQSRKGFNP